MCIVHPLTFWPVSHTSFRLMRASFYFSHRIGHSHDFDFFAYLRESLEEDCSQLVGLSVPIWSIIIISLLLSWAVGERCARPLMACFGSASITCTPAQPLSRSRLTTPAHPYQNVQSSAFLQQCCVL